MSKRKELEIFDKFKNLETKLVDVLKTIPEKIDEEGKESEKANIESYMKKVQEARKLFDEYEALADKLNDMNNKNENDQDSIEISKRLLSQERAKNLKSMKKTFSTSTKQCQNKQKDLKRLKLKQWEIKSL